MPKETNKQRINKIAKGSITPYNKKDKGKEKVSEEVIVVDNKKKAALKNSHATITDAAQVNENTVRFGMVTVGDNQLRIPLSIEQDTLSVPFRLRLRERHPIMWTPNKFKDENGVPQGAFSLSIPLVRGNREDIDFFESMQMLRNVCVDRMLRSKTIWQQSNRVRPSLEELEQAFSWCITDSPGATYFAIAKVKLPEWNNVLKCSIWDFRDPKKRKTMLKSASTLKQFDEIDGTFEVKVLWISKKQITHNDMNGDQEDIPLSPPSQTEDDVTVAINREYFGGIVLQAKAIRIWPGTQTRDDEYDFSDVEN